MEAERRVPEKRSSSVDAAGKRGDKVSEGGKKVSSLEGYKQIRKNSTTMTTIEPQGSENAASPKKARTVEKPPPASEKPPLGYAKQYFL